MKPIWRLLSCNLHYKKLYFTSLITFLLSGIMTNMQPYFVKWITQAATESQYEQALTLAGLLLAVLVAGNLINTWSYYIADSVVIRTGRDMMMRVLSHVHDLDFSYHTSKSSGRLLAILRRGDDAWGTYQENLNHELFEVLISFGLLLYAFASVRATYAWLVVVLFILTLLCSVQLIRNNIRRRKEFSDVDDQVSAVKVDNLVNFDTVKYFAKEKYEQDRLADLLKTWSKRLNDYMMTFRFIDISVGNLLHIFTVAVIGLALTDLQRGVIALPNFLLLVTFCLGAFPRFFRLVFILRELAKRYEDMAAYFGILDEPISVKDPANPKVIENPKGKVVFTDVDFRYGPKQPLVLEQYSLSIDPGESVALVGYSGAGKTTVAKLLMRMYDPTNGTIAIDDVLLTAMAKSYVRSLVGIVPQDPLMFNNTIYYNISYAKPEASRDEVIEAAKMAKVDEFVTNLKDGYETVVGERGIKLSGGQRQRLAIARVILEKPPIILFDEATSSLDSVSEKAIQEAFWQIAKNPSQPKTSIIIAHRLSTIMKADRIIIMDNGKIVEEGTHAQLMENTSGIYNKLWSLQRDGFIDDTAT